MFQLRIGTFLEQCSVTLIIIISRYFGSMCFNRFLDIRFLPSPYVTVWWHALSLLHPTPPPYPNLPGCGASVHLDVAPTHRPQLIFPALTSLAVLDLLPKSLLAPGLLHHVPVNTVNLIRSPPHFPCWTAPRSLPAPRGLPFQGSLPTSDFLCYPNVWPPLYGIYWQPSPLTILSGLCHVLRPLISSEYVSSSLLPHPLLVSSCNWFLLWVSFWAGVRGQGSFNTWQPLSRNLSPAQLGHVVAIQDTRLPHPHTPVLPP